MLSVVNLIGIAAETDEYRTVVAPTLNPLYICEYISPG